MKKFSFARAFLHAEYELERFAYSLDRLEAYDYPSETAVHRIQQLRDTLEQTRTELTSIKSDFELDPDGASDRLQSEYRKLKSLRNHLEIIEGARSDEVPWSLVPSIERLAREIIPGQELLITTTGFMTYMVS